jgi:phage tail-like protein
LASAEPEDKRSLGSEPVVGSRFLFEVDGVEIGVFNTVSGLALTVQTEELIEGGQNGFSLKLPGRMDWPNITFTHGIVQSDALFDWVNKTSGQGFAANGNKLERKTGAITAIGSDGERLRSWSLSGVFAVRWKGPDFDTSSSSSMTEELEIAHEGFTSSTTAQ